MGASAPSMSRTISATVIWSAGFASLYPPLLPCKTKISTLYFSPPRFIMIPMLHKAFRFLYRIEQKLLGRFGLGRLPFVKWIRRNIFPKFQPETAMVWGLTFHLDRVYGFM